ncbi:MAG: hypothetical protein SF066_07095 [Thermoanaerobaculia bacterium]|nr:hypothetical protein [Thermoanaerobaculia bacterium]
MFLLRLLRRIGVVLAVLSLLFGALATVVRWRGARALDRAVKDFETRVGPVNLAAYNLPPVNPETNPAPALRRASELLGEAIHRGLPGETPLSIRLRELAHRPLSEWSAEELAQLPALLERLRPTREQLQIALERRGPSSFGYDMTRFWGSGFPNFQTINGLGDLLLLEARQAEHAGDWAGVARAAAQLGQLAGILNAEAPLVDQLLSYNYERRQYLALRLLAEAPDVDAALIDQALETLRTGAEPKKLARAVGTEGAFLHDLWTVKALAHDWGFGYRARLSLWLAGKRYVADQLGFLADSMDVLRLQSLPTAQWPTERDHGMLWSQELDNGPISLQTAAVRQTATRSIHRLARTALELRRAALTTGTYPKFADTTPSEFTGKPIRRLDLPDGGVLLDLEGAQELWQKHVQPKPERPTELPTEWKLPG